MVPFFVFAMGVFFGNFQEQLLFVEYSNLIVFWGGVCQRFLILRDTPLEMIFWCICDLIVSLASVGKGFAVLKQQKNFFFLS